MIVSLIMQGFSPGSHWTSSQVRHLHAHTPFCIVLISVSDFSLRWSTSCWLSSWDVGSRGRVIPNHLQSSRWGRLTNSSHKGQIMLILTADLWAVLCQTEVIFLLTAMNVLGCRKPSKCRPSITSDPWECSIIHTLSTHTGTCTHTPFLASSVSVLSLVLWSACSYLGLGLMSARLAILGAVDASPCTCATLTLVCCLRLPFNFHVLFVFEQ